MKNSNGRVSLHIVTNRRTLQYLDTNVNFSVLCVAI